MTDHFTPVAQQYATFRPDYPAELFDWLAAITPHRAFAWDCGAGSGQATLPLASRFEHVLASDLSDAQLSSAPAVSNVTYRVAPAEDSGLPDRSVDLVTVAQAMHWFEPDTFHTEVRRVLKPGGIIAAWGYNRLMLEHPEVQRLLDDFYDRTIGSYWPSERVHVENGYHDLPFPYARIETPTFMLEKQWPCEHLLGYLRSWSSVARFQSIQGYDPVPSLAESLAPFCDSSSKLQVKWPLFLHVGKVE